MAAALVLAGKGRLALGAACLAALPILAWVSIVATPSYVWWPMLSAFLPPAAFAPFALSLLAGPRAARVTAWLAVGALLAWLAENVAMVSMRGYDWQRAAPYWLAMLAPLGVAAGYLFIARQR